MSRFRERAQRLFRANLRSVAATAISSPLMDVLGVVASLSLSALRAAAASRTIR